MRTGSSPDDMASSIGPSSFKSSSSIIAGMTGFFTLRSLRSVATLTLSASRALERAT
uniref:Candidate secreted effector n=1 Tax=Meloidogyne incognita TaxID=6306 RepID=A0A914L3Y1_MELIC